MATFTFNDVIAEGAADVNPHNGNTIQNCTVVTLLSGLVKPDMKLTDNVLFEVPNEVIVGDPMPIAAAWKYIKNTLAPQWVQDNYANA